MAALRDRFHELGNWHNKISLAAIVIRESLADGNLTQLSELRLKEITHQSLKALRKIEQYVIGADKTADEMKRFIYKKLGPDTQMST